MVNRAVVLDSGPLGLASNSGQSPATLECVQWLRSLAVIGVRIVVPEIADYEVRRELLRAGKTAGVARLDALVDRTEYLPITTAAMRRAAELWADARRAGRPTAAPDELDADVILAAQALTLGAGEVVVATTNTRHLARYVKAAAWNAIT